MRLWIDTDLALGATRGDVDDGFAVAAVLQALHEDSPPLALLGISCTGRHLDERRVGSFGEIPNQGVGSQIATSSRDLRRKSGTSASDAG